MKIRPYYEPKNPYFAKSKFGKDVVHYWSQDSGEVNDYYYECYVLVDKTPAAVVITDHGVSIDYAYRGKKKSKCIRTNLTPKFMFGDQKHLMWKHISKILETLELIGCEGKSQTRKQMDDLYKKWVSLGRP